MATIEIKHKTKWWKVLLCISAATIVAAGATAGICYALFHKSKTTPISDKITFNNYQASMTSGSQTISATSSAGKPVTLTADGSGKDTTWTFENNTLTYLIVNDKTTVTIKADDGITTNLINIDLLPQGAIPETFYEAHWTNSNGALQVPISSSSVFDTLWFSEFGSTTAITDGVTYQWKAGTTHDSHLDLTGNTVTLSSGLTANTSAEISCFLNGVEKDTIQILAFKSDTTIPQYNFVDVSGYIQSQNTASYVYVTVKGNYTMDNTNLNELTFVSASANDKSSKLQIATGTLDSATNTVTYQVSINPTYATTDIVGNFALKLTPSNTAIDVWNSGDIAIFPSIQTSFNVSCTNPNLTYNSTDNLSLTWSSANFTPTNIQLKQDTSITDKWELNVPSLSNHQMTLSRKSQTLAVGQYPVTIVASDAANNTNEATITVTINNPIETSFNVSCANPNLTFYTTDGLSLTWTSANFTPTTFSLKSDGSSNTNWVLTNNGNHQLTLARQSQTLAVGQYPVTIVASDAANNTNEATITVTITIPIPSTNYIGIKTNNDVISGPITATLDLTSQSLKYLYIPANNVLQTLTCSGNQLTSLDVSNNSNLTYLYCNDNQLTQLNVSGCSPLQTLFCYNNQLTSLDVHNYSPLKNLNCYSNQLQELNVSGCTNLTNLSCHSNQLTSLDVSSNSALTSQLYCFSNPFNLIKLPTTKTSGGFTFSTTNSGTFNATCYVNNGDIYCNSGVTISGQPSGWTKHNS